MTTKRQNRDWPGLPIILTIMLIAGTLNIAETLIDNYLFVSQTQPDNADLVTIRRSLKLVAVSVIVMASRRGVSISGELTCPWPGSDPLVEECFQNG